MLLQEFELLSGIYPTGDLFAAIEVAYYTFDGDKGAFCEAYRANKDGLAETIRDRANLTRIYADASTREVIAGLRQRNDALRLQLEKEQEWRPYASEHNVAQSDYARLAACAAGEGASARYMSDDEAKDWLYREFGFARERVTILHEVDAEEVNRHGQVRKTGRTLDRRPVYDATDYHYIRFDTPHWKHEVWNGMLRPFY